MTTPANLPDAMRARRDAGQALLDATVAFHRAWERYQEAPDGEVHSAGLAVNQADLAVDTATTAYISAVNAEIALACEPVAEGA